MTTRTQLVWSFRTSRLLGFAAVFTACGDPSADTRNPEESDPDTHDSTQDTADTGDSDLPGDTDPESEETADTEAERTGLAGNLSMDTAADAALLGSEALAYVDHAAVAAVGDATGDGVADLVVGVRVAEADACAANGAAFLVAGPVEGRAGLLDVSEPLYGHEPVNCGYGGENAGFAVASVGDVDGDDLSDFLVGAPGYVTRGRAFLIHGGPTTTEAYLEDVAAATFYGSDGTAEPWLSSGTGESIAGAGDVDGDGTPDLLVAEPGAGRAFLLSGHVTGDVDLEAEAEAILMDGLLVVGVGDIDGDGLSDFGVMSGYEVDGIRAAIFLGPTSGVVELAEGDIGVAPDGVYGLAGGAGDLDGDGHMDVVSWGYAEPDDYSTFAVYAFELDGSESLLEHADAAALVVLDDDASTLSLSPTPTGDFNADGHPDLIIGCPEDGLEDGPGAAYVALGPFSGTTQLDDMGALRLHSEGTTDNLGHSVAGAGDLDDDGFDDVLVTAPGYDGVVEDGGAVYVLGGFSI